MWDYAQIQVHVRAGVRPEACGLEQRARLVTQEARVWRGGFDVNPEVRGIKVLGTHWPPNVCDDPVATHLPGSTVVLGPDPPFARRAISVGASGALHVCSGNLFLRVVPPEQSFQFASAYDTALWECSGAVVGLSHSWHVAVLPAVLSVPHEFLTNYRFAHCAVQICRHCPVA